MSPTETCLEIFIQLNLLAWFWALVWAGAFRRGLDGRGTSKYRCSKSTTRTMGRMLDITFLSCRSRSYSSRNHRAVASWGKEISASLPIFCFGAYTAFLWSRFLIWNLHSEFLKVDHYAWEKRGKDMRASLFIFTILGIIVLNGGLFTWFMKWQMIRFKKKRNKAT